MFTHANSYINCSRTLKKVGAFRMNNFVSTSCVSNVDKLSKLTSDHSTPPKRLFSGHTCKSTLSVLSIALNCKTSHMHICARSELDLQKRSYSTHRRPHFKKKERNFYDVLGVTPNATQAQIKAAYYKLSKIYHPDKHQNVDNPEEGKAQLAESQAKFNEISTAYNVLGNPLMKRRYDRGILSPQDTPESVKKQEAASRHDSNVYRPVTDKRIYDFDAFYEHHYGKSIARERQARAEQMRREAEYAEQMASNKSDRLTLAVAAVVFLLGLVYLYEKKNEEKWKRVVSKKKY